MLARMIVTFADSIVMRTRSKSRKSVEDRFDDLVEADRWSAACQLIREELGASPGDHWLLFLLGFAYHGDGKYSRALRATTKGLVAAPKCPVLLDLKAEHLGALKRTNEAIRIYRYLIRRGARSIASDECGEGLRWAKSLVNDCCYKLACLYLDIGDRPRAKRYLRIHLRCRPNVSTLCIPMSVVKKFVREMRDAGPGNGRSNTRGVARRKACSLR